MKQASGPNWLDRSSNPQEGHFNAILSGITGKRYISTCYGSYILLVYLQKTIFLTG